MARPPPITRKAGILDRSFMGRELRPEIKQAVRGLLGGTLKLGADGARAQSPASGASHR